MLYRSTHITRYFYEQPVSQCLSEARVTPRTFATQTLHESHLAVEPAPAALQKRKDYFGNDVTAFTVLHQHAELTATATSLVEVTAARNRQLPAVAWDEVRDFLVEHPDDASLEAYEFVFDSPYVAAHARLAEFGQRTFAPNRPLADVVLELSRRIHTEFQYRPKSTSIDIPLIEVLEQRQGVCQDFTHVMIGVLRSYGLAARYVSGYLRSRPDLLGAEASHAWVAVFVPEYGWMDIDPTNDVMPSEGHITLGWGRDFGDVSPVKGITLGGGGQTVHVEVRVEPVEAASQPEQAG